MVGHIGLKYVSLAAVHPLPRVNALRSFLPLSLLHYFFPLLVVDRGAFESF